MGRKARAQAAIGPCYLISYYTIGRGRLAFRLPVSETPSNGFSESPTRQFCFRQAAVSMNMLAHYQTTLRLSVYKRASFHPQWPPLLAGK